MKERSLQDKLKIVYKQKEKGKGVSNNGNVIRKAPTPCQIQNYIKEEERRNGQVK